MSSKLRRFLIVILLIIFCGSTGKIIYQRFQYKSGDEAQVEAAEIVNLPDFSTIEEPVVIVPPEQNKPLVQPSEPAPSEETTEQPAEAPAPVYVDPYADALNNMDFSALQAVNSDIVGWILIPGTKVSYPLLKGPDNDYYLKRTWKGTRNSGGSIFLEVNNSSSLTDFNTIIYGHNMNNGSMFGTLSRYKYLDYRNSHPYIYVSDNNGTKTYEVFAAYEIGVTEGTYRIGFSSNTSKQDYIDFCMSKSAIATGVTPSVYDRIITLSTCTSRGHDTRWVVQAFIKCEPPKEEKPDQTPVEKSPAEEPQQAPTDVPTDIGSFENDATAPDSPAQSPAVEPVNGEPGTENNEPADTTNTVTEEQNSNNGTTDNNQGTDITGTETDNTSEGNYEGSEESDEYSE